MNKALIIILSTVALDAIGIGLIFPILPALLREVTHSGQVDILYGVMLAIIQHNLKKLLAYHSIENIGIIGIGIGFGALIFNRRYRYGGLGGGIWYGRKRRETYDEDNGIQENITQAENMLNRAILKYDRRDD